MLPAPFPPLDRAVDRLTEAAGGLFSLKFVDGAGADRLVRAAVAGEGCMVGAGLDASTQSGGDRCLLCDESGFFEGGKPVVVVVVIRPNGAERLEDCLLGGLCGCCAGSAGWPQPGWQDRMLELMTRLLRSLWPDFDRARSAGHGTA
jgi:hypothetical protein